MTMMRKWLIIFILVFSTVESRAVAPQSLYLGLDLFTHGILKQSGGLTGEVGFFGAASFPLFVQTAFDLGASWNFAPLIAYTLLPRTLPEGKTRETYLLFSFNFVRNIGDGPSSGFDYQVGPTLIMYSIGGSGGTVTLNNGAGTSTFGVPGSTRTSTTLALNLGAGYNTEIFRYGLDLLTEGLLSDRRTFSLMFSFAYNFLSGGI